MISERSRNRAMNAGKAVINEVDSEPVSIRSITLI